MRCVVGNDIFDNRLIFGNKLLVLKTLEQEFSGKEERSAPSYRQRAYAVQNHTILTDNGIQFARREGTEAYPDIPLDRLCGTLGIKHRRTKINHPWTNGQVEPMNRTIKDATVKRDDYPSYDHLKHHRHTLFMTYHFAKHLKTLKELTPYEYIGKIWTNELGTVSKGLRIE
mgnify:FL=1